MKTFSWLKFTIFIAVTFVVSLAVVDAAVPTPISNVQVTLKGKKYQIDDVTTVAELQERLEEQSGISPSKQGKILHQGKRLSVTSTGGGHLSEAGVSAGDQLNCVPAKKKSSTSSSSTKKKSSSASSLTSAAATAAAPAASGGAPGSDTNSLAEMMKGFGLGGEGGGEGGAGGPGGLDAMIQKMMSGAGGAGGADGGMPDMKESMAMLKELTNSPLFSEYMNDPTKLEESRQMILQNPMMKTMMSSMPGMSELLDNKEVWAQTMIAAGQMMKNMDSEDMIKMMEAQAAGMAGGGMPGGMSGAMGGGAGAGGMPDMSSLFGDNPTLSTTSALDELSEGED
mmetsp:Transcript_31751/g.36447  ORF Transcript_31751/g.36447 Transcript_31751/m.36447 type:complete len:339 (+) Transcript_31751:120-1136(+)